MPIPRYMVEVLWHNVNYVPGAGFCKTRRSPNSVVALWGSPVIGEF